MTAQTPVELMTPTVRVAPMARVGPDTAVALMTLAAGGNLEQEWHPRHQHQPAQEQHMSYQWHSRIHSERYPGLEWHQRHKQQPGCQALHATCGTEDKRAQETISATPVTLVANAAPMARASPETPAAPRARVAQETPVAPITPEQQSIQDKSGTQDASGTGDTLWQELQTHGKSDNRHKWCTRQERQQGHHQH